MKRNRKVMIAVAMTLICGAVTFAAKNDFFHGMNEWFNNKLGGVNAIAYEVSKYAGYASFIVVAAFALMGFVQLIKRKSLFKVDREIICMGFLYIVTLGLYAAFTKIAITYRPAMAPGETILEPSFPSSHTVLAYVVCVSAIMVLDKYITNKTCKYVVNGVLNILWLTTLIFRTQSGVHWISDILAGIIYAVTLVLWYNAAIDRGDGKNEKLPTGGKHYKK